MTTHALAELTTLRVGGACQSLIAATSEDVLVESVATASIESGPVLLIGGGSNILVGDEGWPGTVVSVETRGVAEVAVESGDAADDEQHLVRVTPEVALEVAAGENWDAFVALTVTRGLAGVECLAGIPGRVGATPIQNVGAYGQEVSQVIQSVRVYDRAHGVTTSLTSKDCGFAYRDSMFKRTPDRYVVLSVTFALRRSGDSEPIRYGELAKSLGVAPGERAELASVREATLRLRRAKGMVLDPADHDTWSAGSFFTNPIVDEQVAEWLPQAPRYPATGGVKLSAAWLIEHAGFAKGHGNSRASLSTKHTLALTNRGSATAEDLLALAREIRDGVHAKFQVELVPEPTLINCKL